MTDHQQVIPWVLAAIAKVKGQKQQPNEERISSVLLQSYGLEKDEALHHLQLCVDEDLVSVSMAKSGKNSYRNSKATPGVKGPPINHLKLRKSLDEILNEPIRDQGMTLEEIEHSLRSNKSLEGDLENSEFINQFRAALKYGLSKGRYIKEGKFHKMNKFPPKQPRKKREPQEGKENEDEEENEENISAEERAMLKQICGFCKGGPEKNKYGEEEDLLSCNDCGNSGHPTCMQYSKELTLRVRLEPWQCMECKKCSVCKDIGEAANLLFCDACDKGYHMECLSPALDDMPIGSWICDHCVAERNGKRKRPTSNVPAALLEHNDYITFKSPVGKKGSQKRKGPNTENEEESTETIKGCPTPGCDGTGHSQHKYEKHRSAQFCPILKEQRKKKKEEEDGDEEMKVDSPPPRLPGVTEKDEQMFKNAREKANSYLTSNNEPTNPNNVRCPPKIEFGRYEIETWYSSPYPQEYASAPKLYLCEFCLKYMKTRTILKRHLMKCNWTHPPANEIYRKDNLSMFEVDGAVSKIYCQNLCLLAKLFLDHKTLYYDVEPFLFYVLTRNDNTGSHLIGYFSKEKACQQKNNVSCIMTMPQYQRQGYGRFLIDFSYLLSRKEGQAGSPEKPLSDLGLITYRNYWKNVIAEYLYNHMNDKAVTIKAISHATGMDPHDIAATLQLLEVVQLRNGKVTIVINERVIADHMTKLKQQKRVPIDEEALRWTPLVQSGNSSQLMKDATASSEDEEEDNDEENEEEKKDQAEKTKDVVMENRDGTKANGIKDETIDDEGDDDEKNEKTKTVLEEEGKDQKDDVETESTNSSENTFTKEEDDVEMKDVSQGDNDVEDEAEKTKKKPNDEKEGEKQTSNEEIGDGENKQTRNSIEVEQNEEKEKRVSDDDEKTEISNSSDVAEKQSDVTVTDEEDEKKKES